MHTRLLRIVPAALILVALALGACRVATEAPAPETQATSAPLPEAPAAPPAAPAEKKVAVFIFTQTKMQSGHPVWAYGKTVHPEG